VKYPPNVERRYGDGTYPGDHYAEQALKHAPAWVLRCVRKHREARGLPPLPCTADARIAAAPRRSPPRPAAARSKSAPASVLVGIAAPFVSRPCSSGRDTRKIGERFAAMAWRSIIDDTRSLVVRAGHHGETVASMTDGGIELRLDPLVGLWFVAKPTATDARRLRMLVDDTFGCGVSVTFSRATTRDVTTSKGLVVREIEGARLHDIALIPTAGDARALYEGARAFLATDDSPAAVAAAFQRAKDWATRYGLARV